MFQLAYVPGVTPDKWVRTWQERLPDTPLNLIQVPAANADAVVRDRTADAVLLRLPVERTGLHAIPLYTETTVIVVPKDHPAAAVDAVSADDVADEILLHPHDDTLDWAGPPGRPAKDRPGTTKEAVELVAAGIGLLVVPQSLARLHHRKDLIYRPFPDAPESGVALTWLADETTELMEQFIGIVRGRTQNSTRGRQEEPDKRKAVRKAAPVKSTDARHRRHGGATRGGKPGKPRRRS
jgi:DNA-binding transcriptional LysR family regulator